MLTQWNLNGILRGRAQTFFILYFHVFTEYLCEAEWLSVDPYMRYQNEAVVCSDVKCDDCYTGHTVHGYLWTLQ